MKCESKITETQSASSQQWGFKMQSNHWIRTILVTTIIGVMAIASMPVQAQDVDQLKRELAEVEARRAALQARIDAIEARMSEAEAEAIAANERTEAEARAMKARVTGIEFKGLTGKGLTAEQIQGVSIQLTKYGEGHAAPFGGEIQTMTIGQIGTAEGRILYASALKHIVDTISRAYTEAGLAAVRVNIMRSDIAPLLTETGGVLTVTVTEGIVGGVTGGATEMDAASERYRKIIQNSPVGAGQMVNLHEVDQYIYHLNRHPGRQVDVALIPGERPGEVELEYMIAESKPWFAYFQMSNTGTGSTARTRQRFGFTHFNLTGRDDILTLDYVTGEFDEVHAGTASYEFQILTENRLRGRIYAAGSHYEASDVGFADEKFRGDTISVGAEGIWNFYQDGDLFLDLVGGLRYTKVDVVNEVIDVEGETGFFMPYIGVNVEQRTPLTTLMGSLALEGGVATDDRDIESLGRVQANGGWSVLKYDLVYSTYLEPLRDPNWGQPGSGSTLAHELYFHLRGQIVLGEERLPPNFTYPVGGFYTVRGYPESHATSDTAVVATAEYRFHLPRVLAPREPSNIYGHPFKVAPDRELGRPDWDLILRGFIDMGYAHINDRISSFEKSETLVGVGIGAELQVKRYATLRIDWGFALKDTETGTQDVDSGDDRLHVSLTLMY